VRRVAARVAAPRLGPGYLCGEAGSALRITRSHRCGITTGGGSGWVRRFDPQPQPMRRVAGTYVGLGQHPSTRPDAVARRRDAVTRGRVPGARRQPAVAPPPPPLPLPRPGGVTLVGASELYHRFDTEAGARRAFGDLDPALYRAHTSSGEGPAAELPRPLAVRRTASRYLS
jgi:hypothetical protein